ncbi:MAG: sigma 54-interacting transcriptional regulator [Polyangiaceae bacterium]|nr:sigma 54-interacting transcriptional regulator [Polyangiaceae bacterium]
MHAPCTAQGEPFDASATQLTVTQTIRGTMVVPLIRLDVALNHGRTTASYHVDLAPVVIGTRPSCDIVLNDPHVSSEHCEIRVTEQGVLLRDLGSKNGSWIGTTRVIECVLTEHAVVRIGTTTLKIQHLGPRELPLSPTASFGNAVGQSLMMRAMFAQLATASNAELPILLVGEAGSGRSLLAQAIADRAAKPPTLMVDCRKLRRDQQARTLFGSASVSGGKATVGPRGILDKARGGLIFLGNVDALPEDVVKTLVSALRTQRFVPVGATEPRVFAARVVISVQPGYLEAHGLGDYARAHGAAIIAVPPLRHRKDDIRLLVETFLAHKDPPRRLVDLPQVAMTFFRAHMWPHNVAELKKFVELFLAVENVKHYLANYDGNNAKRPNIDNLLTLPLADARQAVLDHFDRAFLKAKLEQCGGNVSKSAREVGITRQYLHELIAEHGLDADDL